MRRRRQGSGSLFLNGRTWWMQFYQGGERVRESTGCEDRAAAADVLKARMQGAAVEAAHGIAPGHATIADLWELVARDHRIKNVKDQWTPQHRWHKNLEKRWGKMKASKLTSNHILDYVEARRKDGVSDSTINRELEIVRRGFALGMREEPPLVIRAPHFPKLKEDNVRQGFLEPDQYELLLEKLPVRLKALFVCGYHVGTRLGELRHTRKEQVDFEAGVIRIPGSLAKNGKPRTLPIYGEMRRWLEFQFARCPADNPFVFFGRRRRPVGEELTGWEGACEAAGLKGLLFHDLRRSAVRNMKRAKIDDKIAMAISGHRTRSMYERYDIIDEADFSDAGARLEQYHQERKKARAARLRRVK